MTACQLNTLDTSTAKGYFSLSFVKIQTGSFMNPTNYAVITQNEESKWDDVKGDLYHYPNSYKRILETGCKVVYYTGRVRKKTNTNRATLEPHYFGAGIVGDVIQDPENPRNYYCEILDYEEFTKPIIAKREDGTYLETIPLNRASNYWRYAVRTISSDDYESICGNVASKKKQLRLPSLSDDFESEIVEGKKKNRYSSYYERNPLLRQKAIEIHGLNCAVCDFNFEKVYGDLGKGFVHVHHNKPISESGQAKVNPRTDLSVLCPNCHAMIHRKKDATLSVSELKKLTFSLK